MRLLCALTVLIASLAHAQPGKSVLIGTGERGSDYYSVGGAICRSMNRNNPAGCGILPTGGVIDNLYALDLADVNFAIVQADVQWAARRGTPNIPGDYAALQSVASIYTEMLTIVTRADSAIDSFGDLRGHKVAAGTRESGSYWTFLSLMGTLGLNVSDLDEFRVQKNDASAEALCSGTLDALVLMTGHPSNDLLRLGDTCPVRVVALTAAEVRTIAGGNPTYRPISVPPGLYPYIREPVPTVGTGALLVTLASTPDEYVEGVLSAMFEDIDTFSQQQNLLAPVPASEKGGAQECHPAAIRFYRKHGLVN